MEAGNTETLKGVGRAARFVCAAPQEAAAGGFDGCGNGEDLIAILNGAGACDDGHPVGTADDCAVGEFDLGAFGSPRAACKLVRRADAVHAQYAWQDFEFAEVEPGSWAYSGKNGLHFAGGAMDVHPRFFRLLQSLRRSVLR